jgi:D-beta-D-heptose 7-phosphate kinase/D-beta-D-heptose 1-phosphate adenosyltransferase
MGQQFMEKFEEEQTLAALRIEQSRGKKLVFTNGCFDLLHVGHVRYLGQAKALGDLLVLGLNSDNSVRRLKGEARPIVPENDRREVLLALRFVDYVVIFDEDTPLRLIKKIAPNVLVKGGDWAVDEIVGSDFVLSRGGEVFSLPFVEGRSTSSVVEKILKREQ